MIYGVTLSLRSIAKHQRDHKGEDTLAAIIEDACDEMERQDAEIERLRKIEEAARNLSDSLDGGFVRCQRCGDQEDTTNLDFAPELREALGINQQLAPSTETQKDA